MCTLQVSCLSGASARVLRRVVAVADANETLRGFENDVVNQQLPIIQGLLVRVIETAASTP